MAAIRKATSNPGIAGDAGDDLRVPGNNPRNNSRHNNHNHNSSNRSHSRVSNRRNPSLGSNSRNSGKGNNRPSINHVPVASN